TRSSRPTTYVTRGSASTAAILAGPRNDARRVADGAGRARRRDRLGGAEPTGEAERDEPDAERGDDRGAAGPRRRGGVRRARPDRRRRVVLRRHGPEGVLPRGRRLAGPRPAARSAGRELLAVAAPADVPEAHDRDGERLVLRRRVHPARRLRPGDR